MRTVLIASIVAGHGEVASVPILLRRIATEMLVDVWFEPLTPIRQRQDRLSSNKENTLVKAVRLAYQKLTLAQPTEHEKLILVLIDAETELPCVVAPRISSVAQQCGVTCPVVCIIANVEFETWFVAAAESLGDYINLSGQVPPDPENNRSGKGWIASRFLPGRYSETVDQPRLTAKMDMRMCRQRSPSFDKLCRELTKA